MKNFLLVGLGLCLIGCAAGSGVKVTAFAKDFSWESNPGILIQGDSGALKESLMREFHRIGIKNAVVTTTAPLAAVADIALKEDEREVPAEGYDPKSGVYSTPTQDTERRNEYLKTVTPRKRIKVTLATLTVLQTKDQRMLYQVSHEFPVALKNLNNDEVARTLLSPLAEHLKKPAEAYTK